jgi:hypothetical protein
VSARAAASLDIVGKLRETLASLENGKKAILAAQSRLRPFRPKQRDARLAAVLFAATVAACARADDDASFGIEQPLANGRFTLELRPRYNRIDESNKPLLTEGYTVRALAGWISGPWHGVRLTLEAIHTDHIGPKSFNDVGAMNGTSPYPLLPDPRYTGANRLFAEYGGEEGLRVRVGRQVVRVDNQRWVSDNDFRQIPQLFDGVWASYAGIEDAQLEAGRFWRVRTTSGVTNELALSVLRAAWNPAPAHSLAAYAYFHDQAANGASTGFANNSYRVIGAKAEGSAARFGDIDVPYLVEYAQQRPYAGGDDRVRANYWRAGAGAAAAWWTVRYDYEVKGSNGGRYGLQMPLTDFYAFNGWTLHFFNTPRNGLHDQWLTGRLVFGNFTLYGESHRFRSDFGSIGLGRENDVGLTYAILGNLVARLQHARYDPGSGTPDPSIRKTWLTLTYSY